MTRADWLIFAGGVVAGVLAILAVGWAFYVVGRSEDRERAREQAAHRQEEGDERQQARGRRG